MSDNSIDRYDELNSLPEWERKMFSAFNKAEKAMSTDVLGLYIELEQIFQKYYEKGEVVEGAEFYIPMEDVCIYKLKFYEKATEIFNIDMNDNDKECLILSLNDTYNKEYSRLIGHEDILKISKSYIGRKFPASFQNFLKNLKPGQVIAFEEGKSYVCKKNNGNDLCLHEVFNGDIKNLTIDFFKAASDNQITINPYNDHECQRFYVTNKKQLTHSIEAKFLEINKAQLTLNKIYGNLSLFKTKKIDIGPVSLRARKSVSKKNTVLWYDEKGKPISEDSVKYLIGYLNSTPSITEYIRKKPTDEKSLRDEAFAQDMEILTIKKNYRAVFDQMCKYVIDNKQDLTIKTSTYEKDENGKIYAASYTFKEHNGQCKVFKTIYAGNDFTRDALSVKEITAEEFYDFCKKKYEQQHHLLVACALNEIQKQYGKPNSEQILNNQVKIAEKHTEKLECEKPVKVFASEDVRFEKSEIDDLLDSYINSPQTSINSFPVDNFLADEEGYDYDDR